MDSAMCVLTEHHRFFTFRDTIHINSRVWAIWSSYTHNYQHGYLNMGWRTITIRHVNTDSREPKRLQLYTKDYRQPKNAESLRNSLPQGWAQLVIQYQMVAWNTHIQVTLYRLSRGFILEMCVCVCVCVCVCEQWKKRPRIWKNKKGYIWGKGTGNDLYYNLKR